VQLKLDTGAVDWASLIDRSTTRSPPFEEGPKEKGFRDSIVLETFDQLVTQMSVTKGYPRIVLITNDGRLKEAFDKRMSGKSNVLRVDDIEGLKSILNAYVSDIPEKDLKALLQRAQLAFISRDATEGLFHEWAIERAIRQDHSSELLGLPQDANPSSITTDLLSVGPTAFVSKTNDEITFTTYVEFLVTVWANASYVQTGTAPSTNVGLYISNPIYPAGSSSIFPGSLYSGAHSFTNSTLSTSNSTITPGTGFVIVNTPVIPSIAGGTLVNPGAGSTLSYTPIMRGRKVFEVKWRASAKGDAELVNPALIEVKFHSAQ
jgi:hypothetical protein